MKPDHYFAVLAVHPTAQGLGWVIATSPVHLVDWGVIYARGDKNAVCLKRVTQLIDVFAPAVIAMRYPSGSSRRRVKRIATLTNGLVALARARGIEVHQIAEKQVRKNFERFGAQTREQMADVLAANIDALAPRLPRKRKTWMSEDARLGLFDAAALMVAFFIERDLDDDPFALAQAA